MHNMSSSKAVTISALIKGVKGLGNGLGTGGGVTPRVAGFVE
jgi:hypothetical protein